MQVSLTDAQLSRIIELLEKSQEKQTDKYLVSYLRQHQKPTYSGMVSLDDIPF
jgi:hypothetical protein